MCVWECVCALLRPLQDTAPPQTTSPQFCAGPSQSLDTVGTGLTDSFDTTASRRVDALEDDAAMRAGPSGRRLDEGLVPTDAGGTTHNAVPNIPTEVRILIVCSQQLPARLLKRVIPQPMLQAHARASSPLMHCRSPPALLHSVPIGLPFNFQYPPASPAIPLHRTWRAQQVPT